MHSSRLRNSLVLAAWLLFFLPSVLAEPTAKTIGQTLLAALCFSPLLMLRPLQALTLLLLTLLGVGNLIHISFFGTLMDEFFLATALRTTSAETAEFLPTVPVSAWVSVALWILACGLAGRYLWRTLPIVRQESRWLRRVWQAAGGFWLLVLVYTLVQQLNTNTFIRKAKSLYPLHVVRAVLRQQEIADGLFQPPVLPDIPVDSQAQVDTVVVILGESATSQRWSLLGYQGAPTNAPLASVPGIAATTVLAQGWNTAAALPYVLTGMSALDGTTRQAPSFIDLAQQAGYKTFAFSNSRFFSAQEDFFSYVLRRASTVYKKVGNGDFDEVLTDSLAAALADLAPKKLIVLHTYGSHIRPESRYPASAQVFADSYDNSIHYSSDLLAQWIGLVERTNPDRSALLLYTSDHGVTMPPCADGYRSGTALSSYEVPMLVWANPVTHAQHAPVLPIFAQSPQAGGPGQAPEHSNALLAETAMRAVGYGALLEQADWPSSAKPGLNGIAWATLRQRNACTLQ